MEMSAPLTKANITFSLALFKNLADENKTGNIFYSPFSISSALAMVMLGAGGNTAAQMSEVLCFSEAEQSQQPGEQQSVMQSQIHTRMQMQRQIQQSSRLPQYLLKYLKSRNGQDDVHTRFAKLLSELIKPDTLHLANRLYGEQSYQFVEDFSAETRKHYSAELESVDFKTSADTARQHINSWVEEQTSGKIRLLLAEDMVDASTSLVLVTAVYFKDHWSQLFEEDFTVGAQFRINKDDTKPVRMMYQKSEFSLVSIPEANCQILEMPYKGKDLSMLIFLPNEIEDDTTGLEKLERELTYEKYVEWTHGPLTGQTEVEVKLPRFKMEEKYELNDVLKSMGMVDAFDASMSNFSGMSPANDLLLSKVVHKALMEVSEEGTEAAVVMTTDSGMVPATFTADHPFLFFIRHNPSSSVLFAGRYCSPE